MEVSETKAPRILHCIKCEKQMQNFSGGCHQPDNGLAFHTLGHYGSTYFDPMDGSYLELSVCDECVKEADKKGLIGHGELDRSRNSIMQELSDEAQAIERKP